MTSRSPAAASEPAPTEVAAPASADLPPDRVRADRGDLIRLRARRAGDRDRVGTVLETRGVNGEPPFVVRWDDSGVSSFLQPGADAVIDRRKTASARTSRARTSVTVLGARECDELLARAIVGRLGVVIDGRPEIFPVCHVANDGQIAFLASEGTKLHVAEDTPSVIFEVDGMEPDGTSGWSVVVRGRLERIDDPAEAERLATDRTAPWETGPSARWLRIVPSDVTGRRYEAVPTADA